jgi:hypothetical protein
VTRAVVDSSVLVSALDATRRLARCCARGHASAARSGGVEGRGAAGAELARGALEALGVAGGEDDVGALGACAPGRFESDAGAAADDDDGLAE